MSLANFDFTFTFFPVVFPRVSPHVQDEYGLPKPPRPQHRRSQGVKATRKRHLPPVVTLGKRTCPVSDGPPKKRVRQCFPEPLPEEFLEQVAALSLAPADVDMTDVEVDNLCTLLGHLTVQEVVTTPPPTKPPRKHRRSDNKENEDPASLTSSRSGGVKRHGRARARATDPYSVL
ncbi:hypothetical protein MIND_01106900 [Mycena indigotica]|uniref:Uncharacterized protein n=1 Tax=Mycena indigotica TaxID=2126181 RepID=A0A8H6VXM8_9AGAR|nr:uncharacterized protein MIND_01106900 [Mycena indigotica]KAF7295666.1 hypothetical protein MIND_01106900 [Mycena indigotica]